MKTIKTMADLESLRRMGRIPLEYVNAIESEFLNWFEAEGAGESIMAFEMPQHACMYHLEDKNDTPFLSNQILNIEYVEKEELKDCTYFRIGIMNDHQMNLVYFLEGTLDQKFEKWLER